jgi:hypothetical protein
MNESQPIQSQVNLENKEAIKNIETEIPRVLAIEKPEIMDLFRGDNPGNPETKRLVTLWMEEARKSVEGIEDNSPARESLLKAAQENLFTVANLARWDMTKDPEAVLRYDAWLVKGEAWVSEAEGITKVRRQIILEMARSDMYLSAGDEGEAYNCLDQAVWLSGGAVIAGAEEVSGGFPDLREMAQDKIDAITKVLNFLNENAKKSQ